MEDIHSNPMCIKSEQLSSVANLEQPWMHDLKLLLGIVSNVFLCMYLGHSKVVVSPHFQDWVDTRWEWVGEAYFSVAVLGSGEAMQT